MNRVYNCKVEISQLKASEDKPASRTVYNIQNMELPCPTWQQITGSFMMQESQKSHSSDWNRTDSDNA